MAYEVRHVREHELQELWELDRAVWGDTNLSLEILRLWWESYRRGIYVLLDGGKIIGALGIWPLEREPFLEILEGRAGERDLTVQNIQRTPTAGGFDHWFISGIWLAETARQTHALQVFLSEALSLWLAGGNLGSGVRVCAFAYSEMGEMLLRRFGFRKYKDAPETVERLPVFLGEASGISELQQVCSGLKTSGGRGV